MLASPLHTCRRCAARGHHVRVARSWKIETQGRRKVALGSYLSACFRGGQLAASGNNAADQRIFHPRAARPLQLFLGWGGGSVRVLAPRTSVAGLARGSLRGNVRSGPPGLHEVARQRNGWALRGQERVRGLTRGCLAAPGPSISARWPSTSLPFCKALGVQRLVEHPQQRAFGELHLELGEEALDRGVEGRYHA